MRGTRLLLTAVVVLGSASHLRAQMPAGQNMFQQRQSAQAPQGGGFYALYENAILTPAFSRNDAFFNTDGVNGISPQFGWGMTYSPRVEIGFSAGSEGLGLTGRYWHMSSASAVAPLPGMNSAIFSGAPDIQIAAPDLTASHAIRIEQIDGAITLRRGNVGVIGGVQYMKLHQDYAANAGEDAGITIAQEFSGVGPTLGLEGRQPLGSSALALFANGRASLLFGKRDLLARDLPTAVFYERSNATAMFPTTQVQVGIEYTLSMGSKGNLLLRASLEAQYFPNGGAGFRAAGGAGDPLSDPQSASMGFFGATVGIGMTW